MNGTAVPYNLTLPSTLDGGYLRVALEAYPLYRVKQPVYLYTVQQPQMSTRGIVSMEPTVPPNASSVKIEFNVTFKPTKEINLSTFVDYFYAQNFTFIPKLGGQQTDIHNFTGAVPSFYGYRSVGLGPGRYILMLMNFSDNTEIAGGYFVVPKYNVSLVQANLTAGLFVFKITSNNTPLNNIRYNISINKLYPASGVIQSGVIAYRLPQGTPQITSGLNFSIGILGQEAYYTYTQYVAPITINTQYIEVGMVIIMIIIMVVFVRAPTRDEFYIDVPNLPESKKLEIKLKSAEVLAVFDKLNASYHWKYMPLSKTEVKAAIALNIKYNNIPVELTYRNIEAILDSLLVNKYIVGADDLYAPVAWVEASKHDITYLATFKKLRIYFVTHSYSFTDLDASDEADIVATLHSERKYMVIYSDTSRFRHIPIYPGSRTYLVFLNSDAMGDFVEKLYSTTSASVEKLKMYISADYIRLVDADNIEKSDR
jgi:ribosome-associated toxin RatA of RatAB toxin-antitoxin module